MTISLGILLYGLSYGALAKDVYLDCSAQKKTLEKGGSHFTRGRSYETHLKIDTVELKVYEYSKGDHQYQELTSGILTDTDGFVNEIPFEASSQGDYFHFYADDETDDISTSISVFTYHGQFSIDRYAKNHFERRSGKCQQGKSVAKQEFMNKT